MTAKSVESVSVGELPAVFSHADRHFTFHFTFEEDEDQTEAAWWALISSRNANQTHLKIQSHSCLQMGIQIQGCGN